MRFIATDEPSTQRICWLAILLGIIGAYTLSIAPQERSMRALQGQAQSLYERANANDAIVKDAATLQEARARVVRDVNRLRGEANASAAMAGTVQLLDTEGSQYHVAIRAITPDASPPPVALPSGRASTGADPLVGQPVTLVVNGRFRDLLRLFADLPRHGVLLEVDDVTLRSNARASASSPLLDATLSATLYHLSYLSYNEVTNGTGSVR